MCDSFEDFPSFSCSDEMNFIHLNSNSTIKWRNVSFPKISFNGCWKLFLPSHNQNPESLTRILMCALNDGSTNAMDKITMFCADKFDWLLRRSASSLVSNLKKNGVGK